jgi:hypothetical protein
MDPRNLGPGNKSPPRWFRRHLLKIPERLPKSVRRRFRDLNKEALAGKATAAPEKSFDTSGKSPAYPHHRKNFRARAGKPAAGFLNRRVIGISQSLSSGGAFARPIGVDGPHVSLLAQFMAKRRGENGGAIWRT